MGFTPKFQKLLDDYQKLVEEGKSPEELQEYFKIQCTELGPWERLQNMYRIRPKLPVPGEKTRLAWFTPNKMQREFWNNHTNRDLVLKMRQGGVTTFSCLIALDKALFETGVHTAIMAHVKDNVKKFFRIIKIAFKSFQKDWGHLYPISQDVDNVNELKIKQTDSTLSVITESKGLTLDFLHVSEASFVEDSRISESLESVPLSGWVIMETTPDTASGLFYKLWDQAQKREPCSFKDHFFPWFFHYPEESDYPYLKPTKEFKLTDEEIGLKKQFNLDDEHLVWRRMKISECGGDIGEFKRKYPEDPLTCFLAGSRSVFPTDILAMLWKNERNPLYIGQLAVS